MEEKDWEKMENKILKAVTGTPVPKYIAKLWYDIVSEQLTPKQVSKMNYKDIRKMFWKDITYDFTE